jgi:hypothetical protein
MKELAPIALFVYNRPTETAGLLESLKKNKLSKDSLLFIFSDAPRSPDQEEKVKETRAIINELSGFKNIEIFQSRENKGLAHSVIAGVSKIIERYGRIIVLEDDLVLANDFLEYMNDALDLYEKNDSIWTVTGYGPPINIGEDYKSDVYLSYRGCSWGWGTWKDRWEKHDWYLSDYNQFISNPNLIKKFKKGGNDLLEMLKLQKIGKLDSWAIRSCYSQSKEDMYTVYPVKSKLQNIGFGESSTHCTSSGSKYKTELYENKIILTNDLDLNNDIIYEFKKYYDLDLIGKIGYFLKKNNLYKFFRWTKSYLRK